MLELNKIYHGDSLKILKTFPDECIDCAVTSPPYWSLRDYGVEGQLGLEPTFQEYIEKLVRIFDEVKRVLKKEGTCFVNLGDTYSGNKEWKTDNKVCDYLKDTTKNLHKKIGTVSEKSLCQIPSRFAIAMSDNGWILRNEIIWWKPNAMPSSVGDRFTVDFEKIFFFVKSKKYYFEPQLQPYTKSLDRWGGQIIRGNYKTKTNQFGIKERSGRNMRPNDEGKNMRAVWSINTQPFPQAHFAVYPEKLIYPMIKAGCPEKGTVLDIFMGSGATAKVARMLGRNYVGIELNKEYIKIAEKRLAQQILC